MRPSRPTATANGSEKRARGAPPSASPGTPRPAIVVTIAVQVPSVGAGAAGRRMYHVMATPAMTRRSRTAIEARRRMQFDYRRVRHAQRSAASTEPSCRFRPPDPNSVLRQQLPLCLFELCLLRRWHLRVLQAERLNRVHQNGGHDASRNPLVVGGNHPPRRPLRARLRDGVFVRLLVVIPVLPLLQVRGGELPILVGLLEPFEEALLLFLLRHVEEELQDERAVAGQVALEAVDVIIAIVPESATSLAG